MADLENRMSLFRDKLDQKTYDFIFQTLVTNQFKRSKLTDEIVGHEVKLQSLFERYQLSL